MDDTKNGFVDFIPADQDSSAYTEDGYQDFVPAPQPQPQRVEETPIEPLPIDEEDQPVNPSQEVTLEVESNTPLETGDEVLVQTEDNQVFDATITDVTPEATQWDAQQFAAEEGEANG